MAAGGSCRYEVSKTLLTGRRGGIWEDPAQDKAQVEWARRFAAALTPGSAGASYVNYMNADEPSERVRLAYGDSKFDRLRQIKKRYDPENVFRFNQNILPAV